MSLAEIAALRSEDPYKKVGCCILRPDHSVAGLGYNGAPTGITIDWTDREQRRLRVVHAETNALRYIKPGEAGLVAVTLLPCNSCLLNLAAYQVKEICYKELYDKDLSSVQVAKELGITLILIS